MMDSVVARNSFIPIGKQVHRILETDSVVVFVAPVFGLPGRGAPAGRRA
jgi:hypothetical protein